MSCFVLVHGAWHGAWCWRALAAALRAAGHTVHAPDLPGHGEDATPAEAVTLAAYTDRVVAVLDACEAAAVLVGHSMGGMVISAAAEQRPEHVAGLVYVSALLPVAGESLRDVETLNPAPVLGEHLIIDEARGLAEVQPEALRELFYHDCSEAHYQYARARLVPQPTAPLLAPLALSEAGFGRVPKAYVECTEDRALCPAFQRLMQARYPAMRAASLASSHSPFFSMPGALAACLDVF